jgi:hypothetical protein
MRTASPGPSGRSKRMAGGGLADDAQPRAGRASARGTA